MRSGRNGPSDAACSRRTPPQQSALSALPPLRINGSAPRGSLPSNGPSPRRPPKQARPRGAPRAAPLFGEGLLIDGPLRYLNGPDRGDNREANVTGSTFAAGCSRSPRSSPFLGRGCGRSARREINHAVRNPHLVTGIVFERFGVDGCAMFWPVAALAVFILGFAIVYGSVVQSRLEANRKESSRTR